MYQDRIEYLKRAIKRTYKRYIGERTDANATLLDVAKFFNIPVDETRIENYSIKKIDYNIPSIEIKDEKNNITYTATYTGNADLLNFSTAKEVFNSVISISPAGKKESLYYISAETPIITKMTFTDGEYELVFEREMANSIGIFANDGVKMAIRYLQNVVYDGRNVKQPLFNKIYKNGYEKYTTTEFEQTYTYGPHHFIKFGDSEDKYAYIVNNNNVIYGINELEQSGLCHYLHGICFESTCVPVSDYFPLNMHAKNYPLLSENNINSAMIFRFGTGDAIHHSFQAYKSNDCIKIIFHSAKHDHKGSSHIESLANEEYSLPSLSEGTISSEEIKNILSSLQARLGDDEALGIISSELTAFGTKIDIRKGIVQEELDPLDPKLFIDKSFEEICALVSANKDDYFRLMREQFEMATNTNRSSEKGQSKVLIPKNSQSSKN